MSNFDVGLKHLLALEPGEIRLKWVFDHVRNYGLAATVIVAGFYLLKHGAVVSLIPAAGSVIGVLFIILGMGLFCLNILQPIVAMAKHKSRALSYFVVSIVLFLGGSELVWVIIERMQVQQRHQHGQPRAKLLRRVALGCRLWRALAVQYKT